LCCVLSVLLLLSLAAGGIAAGILFGQRQGSEQVTTATNNTTGNLQNPKDFISFTYI
jgi:hypothetical protein